MSMKKTYEKPKVDLVELEEKDIIITSGELKDNWDKNFDNAVDKF